MKKTKYRTHLVIPDAQVRPGTPINHLEATGQMIIDLKPDVVICIGDFWDMHSLSSYDMGKLAGEGCRYDDDIFSGNAAMAALMHPIRKFRDSKAGKDYKPKMLLTLGNHENRINRHVESHPILESKLSIKDLDLSGWSVSKFLEVVEADGVCYSHYFYNPLSGKPYGGSMLNLLNKIGTSFTQGHVQKLDFGRKELGNGKVVQGLVAGAFYQHDEEYKGPQGNHHWRGLIYKHDVRDGNYDLETWDISRVLKTYG